MKNKFIKVVAMIMFFALTTICLSGCSTEYYQLTKAQKQKLFNKYASIEIEYEGYKLVYADDERTSTSEVSQETSIYETSPLVFLHDIHITGNYGEKNRRGVLTKTDILKNGKYYMTYNFGDNEIYKEYNSITIYDEILNHNRQRNYNIEPRLDSSCSFDGKLFIITTYDQNISSVPLWGTTEKDFVYLYFIPMLFVFDEVEETFKYAGFLEEFDRNKHCSYKIIKE